MKMNRLDQYITLAGDVIYKPMDSSSVLLNLNTGGYYSLNPTGAFMLSLIDGNTTLDQIARRTADRYGVDLSTVRSDLLELVADLEKETLVRLHDAPGVP